jgi:ParB/RepB/Spo0J family partition protein
VSQLVPAGSVHQRASGQDRERFDPVELASLAASIKRDGCLSPPHVRADGAGGWEIILGERRVRAMRDVLGWDEIPVEIDTVDDETAARRMLVENVNRSDLDPIAEARAYQSRIDRFGTEPAAIARECGIPPARVRNRLRLLALSDHVAHYVATRQLPLGHATAMVGLDGNRQALALQAYNDGPLGLAVFERLCAKLHDEQAVEEQTGMFDAADFFQVEEWVRESEELVKAGQAPAVEIVREPCYGIDELATMLVMSKAQLRARIRSEAFPAADLRIGNQPVWWAGTVEEWCADTGHGMQEGMIA